MRGLQLHSFLVGHERINRALGGFLVNPELKAIRQHRLQQLMVNFFRGNTHFGCGLDIVMCAAPDPDPVWTALNVRRIKGIREAQDALDRDISEPQSSMLKRWSLFAVPAADIFPDRDHIETGARGRRLSERNERHQNDENPISDCFWVQARPVYQLISPCARPERDRDARYQ